MTSNGNSKRSADPSGKSGPQLVADYSALIEAGELVPGDDLTPRVRALVGVLKHASVTEDDYRRYLETKYG